MLDDGFDYTSPSAHKVAELSKVGYDQGRLLGSSLPRVHFLPAGLTRRFLWIRGMSCV